MAQVTEASGGFIQSFLSQTHVFAVDLLVGGRCSLHS